MVECLGHCTKNMREIALTQDSISVSLPGKQTILKVDVFICKLLKHFDKLLQKCL